MKDVFGSALERDPSERATYLQEACGGDDEFRAEIQALLTSYDSEATLPGPREADPEATDPFIGTKVGPYQVIRRIGEGGMGVVYLAVRSDETFHKQVALKVVQASVTGAKEVLERFRHERRILATLDHPNIAKLLDGGATPQGMPYFAMDYVEGIRIDDYCEQRDLPVADRLGLFRDVCSAVQYVHQNLVVHRDLKPGNILVTAAGVPKLLDFGIAKLLNPERRSDLTQADNRPMTPSYASPEQVRGDAVTTASDVYSLGVILFSLLTARLPYRFKNESAAEIQRAVCEEQPEKPSAVVAARPIHSDTLRRQLTGDLDNIVLKALEKDPHRRYVSAEQLSEDLRRHTEGLPVSARPDTWSYRAGKFVRRHAVGVTAAVLVVSSLAAGLAAAMWQANVARRERANAQQQFNDVRRLTNSFLFEFHAAIQHLPGSTPARKLVVQKALEYLNRLAAQAHGDRGLERELAEAYLKVGDVQGNPYWAGVGDSKGAVESYSQALRISEGLAGDPKDVSARVYLARSHQSLGQVLPIVGRPGDGLTHLRKAAETWEALSATDPAWRTDLANTYLALGDLEGHPGLQNMGDAGMARTEYQKARSLFESQVTQDAGNQARRGLAVVRVRMADLEIGKGDLKKVLVEYRAALEILESLSAEDATNAESSFRLALGYRKVGVALEGLGERKAALENYAKAAAVNERLMKADPENVQSGMGLAITLRYTGDLLAKGGDRAGALANYQRVLAILERLSAIQPGNILVEGRRAEMLLYVSSIVGQNGNLPEARRLTATALGITSKLAERTEATSDDLFGYAENFLSCTPPDLREPKRAVEYAKRAAAKPGGGDSAVLDLLARAYAATGDLARAVEEEEKAIGQTANDDTARRAMEGRLAQYRSARARH